MPGFARHLTLFAAALFCAVAVGDLRAEPAGEVRYARGAFTATDSGGETRFLGKGMEVLEGDTLTTGRRGFAIVEMVDGGKMTLRPNTAFAIEQYHDEAGNRPARIALKLFRGGLRSLTGLIGRRRPEAYQMNAGTATIGIRGTEFDVRWCEGDDCAAEASGDEAGAGGAAAQQTSAPPDTQVVGAVVRLTGDLTATAFDGRERALGRRGRIYAGDALETGPDSFAMLVFRDDTRVALKGNTVFVVDDYAYTRDDGNARALFRLVRGGLRAVTGLIGKQNRRGFRLATTTATIGIRGTGFDAYAGVNCDEGRAAAGVAGSATPEAEDACIYVNVWDGAVDVEGRSDLAVETGETAFVDNAFSDPALLDQTPAFIAEDDTPRPDTVETDLEALFGVTPADPDADGLYVSVFDGEVVVETPQGSIDLRRGEASRVDPETGEITRLSAEPVFITGDRFPRPSRFDEGLESAFDLLGDDLRGLEDLDTLECRIN